MAVFREVKDSREVAGTGQVVHLGTQFADQRVKIVDGLPPAEVRVKLGPHLAPSLIETRVAICSVVRRDRFSLDNLRSPEDSQDKDMAPGPHKLNKSLTEKSEGLHSHQIYARSGSKPGLQRRRSDAI